MVSGAVAFIVVAAVAWLQIPSDANQSTDGSKLPVLGLAQTGRAMSAELLAEQLAAYDPTPMFIPTRMSSNEPALPEESTPGVGGPFAALPAELTRSGSLKFTAPVPVPSSPAQGLRLTERPYAPLVMARADEVGRALPARLGQLETIAVDTGRVVLTLDLAAVAAFPIGDWQPLELLASVSRAGLVGELVVTSSSGSDEIDEYFRSHLKRNVRIGERLSEGFYAFRVGP
ncbi:hypothetical protein RAHE111665_12940 [Rariglobus hedericola]